ncbi:hypothetical protein [Candidatus Synchoanobacter obligatus]|uniref:Uncharacterized protein n=1 Tax=Candidatus Synchoanobacter obligatus TaxID=2919597 RepID=A0ABT1L587_9GAMM|nr:hypothetical protein [Candidatus Synchoanobacter obligatus]MCP8352331.1 hypothetical protein [Candidatus Synchoanobacter obligatus]
MTKPSIWRSVLPALIAVFSSILPMANTESNSLLPLQTWSNTLGGNTTTPGSKKAKKLQSITQEGMASNVSIMSYLTGENAYKDRKFIDRVAETQVIFDLLLIGAYKDDIPSDSHIKQVYHAVATYTPDQAYINGVKEKLNIIKDSWAYKDYINHYRLYRQSRSCELYWDGSEKVNPPFLMASNWIDYNTKSLKICQKAICTTRPNEPFNQFHNISKKAEKISKNPVTSDYDSQEVQHAKQAWNNYHSLRKLTANRLYTLAEGEAHIKQIVSLSREALGPLQVNLVKAITQTLTSRDSSFKLLYDPGNQQTRDNTVNTPDLDRYIARVVDVSANLNAISPGLDYWVDSDEEFIALIAGQYMAFYKETDDSDDTKTYWKSSTASLQEDTEYFLYMKPEYADNILEQRSEIKRDFHKGRNIARAKILQFLTTKSAIMDILDSVKSLQNATITDGKNHLTTLQKSSLWRLENDWRSRISTMANVNLHREIVVLLAEIKQLQFFTLISDLQKLALLAVNAAAKNPIDTTHLANIGANKNSEYHQGLSNSTPEAIEANEEEAEKGFDKINEMF